MSNNDSILLCIGITCLMVGAEPLIVCDCCWSRDDVVLAKVDAASGPASTLMTLKLWNGHLCAECRDYIKDGDWRKLSERHVTEEEAKAGLLHLREDLLEK